MQALLNHSEEMQRMALCRLYVSEPHLTTTSAKLPESSKLGNLARHVLTARRSTYFLKLSMIPGSALSVEAMVTLHVYDSIVVVH